ncbi:MAG TPA: hypothetical protein VKR27_00800 [Acidimicrobiales bacterium]|nr:hypothetical protein [Acidimicrobiales bacterium]
MIEPGGLDELLRAAGLSPTADDSTHLLVMYKAAREAIDLLEAVSLPETTEPALVFSALMDPQ